MQEFAAETDVGGAAVFTLYHSGAGLEVTRVAPRLTVRRMAVRIQMAVAAVAITHRAPLSLIVPAPRVALPIEVHAIGKYVVPSIAGDDRGPALVEAECIPEPPAVRRSAFHVHVPGHTAAPDGREAGRVEGEHLVEARRVKRLAVPDVVGLAGGHLDALPAAHLASTGLRIVHPRQSARLR